MQTSKARETGTAAGDNTTDLLLYSHLRSTDKDLLVKANGWWYKDPEGFEVFCSPVKVSFLCNLNSVSIFLQHIAQAGIKAGRNGLAEKSRDTPFCL